MNVVVPADVATKRPRHTILQLGALAGAVPSARRHAQNVIREWGMPELVDTTALLVSELVTNAVTASGDLSQQFGTPPVRLLLVAGHHGVLIQVWDASNRMPAEPSIPEPLDAENGRGLLLVEALSARWGAYRSSGIGKVVWAVVEPPRLRHHLRGAAPPKISLGN